MNYQNRRHVRMHKVNGRDFMAELFAFLGRFGPRTKCGFELFESSDPDRILAGFPVVQEIGGRKEAGGALDLAALAVHGIFGPHVSFGALRCHRQRKMPARASAGDAKAVGIDSVLCRVMTNKSHGAVNVGFDLRNAELRLRTMDHRKNRVTAIEQRPKKRRIDRLMARKEAATNHQDNSDAVGLTRLKHVQRQRRTELTTINDVFGTSVIRTGLRPGRKTHKPYEYQSKTLSHKCARNAACTAFIACSP